MSGDPTSKLPRHDGEMLLPRSMRSALQRELSPTRVDRNRVRAAVTGVIAGAAASAIVGQTEVALAARAAQLKAGVAIAGKTLATKLIVSSLVIASAGAAITTGALMQRSSAPAAARVQPVQPRAEPIPQQPTAATPVASEPQPAAAIEPTEQPAAAAPIPSHALPRAREHRTRRVHEVTPVQPPATTEAVASEPAAATEAAAENVPTAPPPAAAKPAAVQRPSTLAQELELVRGASDALNRHDPARALSLLARYDQTHPNGSLATEARALRTIALCAASRPEAASARDAFLRDHAGSALAERVRSGCP